MPIYYPISIITINNKLFTTANIGIYKSDNALNLIESYIRTDAYYKGIYYYYTADILYVASYSSKRIDLFYRNLSFISSISLTNIPYALTEKNDKLYVGIEGGLISVVENNLVVKNITTMCTSYIRSIVIDANDLMGVLCWINSMLYLYTTNGSYTGKSITTPLSPRFISYDLNGYFIISNANQINIFY
jgi:hypothetical protein